MGFNNIQPKYLEPLVGSMYLLTSVVGMYVLLGRVTGVNGMIQRSLQPDLWRISFLFGLLISGISANIYNNQLLGWYTPSSGLQSFWNWIIAGWLVGYGAKRGSGCTSGHMLCGVSRFSRRSIIASACFVSSGMIARVILPSDSGFSMIQERIPSEGDILNQISFLFAFISILMVGVLVTKRTSWLRPFISLWCGFIFGCGLILAKMTQARVVIGFLSLLKDPLLFDPTLLSLVLGAVVPLSIIYNLYIAHQKKTLLNDQFDVPSRTDIDKDLIIGSIAFGFGWGVCGICPGPLIVNLPTGQIQYFIFGLFMFLGSKSFNK
ncbi:hypothetical protein BC833DRAFT_599357 [Globomyces pollinis-pini]|nr:hypothetical protein BC833DRAFT_599357 [Globomyces pollinis-pini]